MRTLCAKHPVAMIERSRDDNSFTLIHGDAGSYNILVPLYRDQPIYIIDRQPFNWSLTTYGVLILGTLGDDIDGLV